MKYLNSIMILVWFILSIYLGCGGLTSLELSDEREAIEKMEPDEKDTNRVIYQKHDFPNKSAAMIWEKDQKNLEKKRLAGKLFPWLDFPYNFMGLLITSFAFGALGATVSLLRRISLEDILVENSKVFSHPLLGGGTGITVLSISYILPVLIATGETKVRPISIVFVSLFAGLFAEQFFAWLNSNFGKIFKSKTP